MPRAPNAKKEEAEKLFHKGLKLAEIAKKLEVPEGTVRSWKNRGGWDKEKDIKRNVADNKTKSNATLHKKKQGGQPKNKNAKGSKGGGAPRRNKNAEKHGFFSKHLPEDSLSILEELEGKSHMDILQENIQLSYAAILRAQKSMYVSGKDEMIKEVKKLKKKTGVQEETEVEWEFQFPWDRQATFLTAQAKAMAELRSLIRQYEEMENEESKARAEKVKAETERLKDSSEGNSESYDWVEAMQRKIAENESEDDVL